MIKAIVKHQLQIGPRIRRVDEKGDSMMKRRVNIYRGIKENIHISHLFRHNFM